MAAIQYKWVITNGELGTLDNSIVRYSVHSNGRRALQNAIERHANRTKRESWAEIWEAYGRDDANRYYPRTPTN